MLQFEVVHIVHVSGLGHPVAWALVHDEAVVTVDEHMLATFNLPGTVVLQRVQVSKYAPVSWTVQVDDFPKKPPTLQVMA